MGSLHDLLFKREGEVFTIDECHSFLWVYALYLIVLFFIFLAVLSFFCDSIGLSNQTLVTAILPIPSVLLAYTVSENSLKKFC